MAFTPSPFLLPAQAKDGDEAYEMVAPDFTPISSLLTTHMATVLVGPKRKAFHLHQDLLCDRSDYFKAAFTGNFQEAGTKELFLPDDSDAAFELFVNWLYGSAFRAPSNDNDLQAHLALLALSEKLMLEYLTNQCIDLIRIYYRDTKAIVRIRDITFAYDEIQSLGMRRFLALLAAVQTIEIKGTSLPPGIQQLISEGGQFSIDFSAYLLHYARLSEKILIRSHLFTCDIYHSHNSTPKCKGLS